MEEAQVPVIFTVFRREASDGPCCGTQGPRGLKGELLAASGNPLSSSAQVPGGIGKLGLGSLGKAAALSKSESSGSTLWLWAEFTALNSVLCASAGFGELRGRGWGAQLPRSTPCPSAVYEDIDLPSRSSGTCSRGLSRGARWAAPAASVFTDGKS